MTWIKSYGWTHDDGLVWFMVFNTTFNNISVILWRSVLLVEVTGGHREIHRPVVSHHEDGIYHMCPSVMNDNEVRVNRHALSDM